jgi:ferritin-like metal-binding protein YciE
MERGRDFLRAQVDNAVMQHRTLLDNLENHAKQADDQRYRTLCERHLPGMRQHQRLLEDYQATLGEGGGDTLKKALGAILGFGRDAVDAMRESDFLRIVGDVVMIRQAQDTFATFAAVGDRIGEPRMAEIGRNGARDHEQMAREFNDLAHEMFVEHAREG